jgi:dipeptidyl aminopeptidase/acylaminoacyl peptidase
MRLEDLFRMRAVGRVAMAPNGRRVVFELKRFDYEKNKNFTQLMVVDRAAGPPRPLTEAGEHNDTHPRWAPDGSRLAFISDRDKTSALWILPMAGGEPRRLTDRDGRVKDFDFSPDGRKLAYTCQALTERERLERDEKTEEVKKLAQFKHITRLTHKLDGAGFWNGLYTHVYVIGADGGPPKRLTRGDYDHAEPRFSPDGRSVSFVSNQNADPDRDFDQSAIFVVPVGGGRTRRVTQGTGHCAAHAWAPDGATLAFVGSPCKPGEWWKHDEHVWLVDAKGGRPRELTRDIDNTCENVTIADVAGMAFETPRLAFSADGARLFFLVSERGATRLYSRSLRGRDTRCEVGGPVNVYSYSRGDNGDFALAMGTATNPGDVFVRAASDPPDQPPTRLSAVNEDVLKGIQIVEPEEFALKSGATTLQCWVIRPPDFRANRKHPAVLEIHGGPQAQYGYTFFHEMQLLAARGYVVAYTNPRGSGGYGREHRKCIIGDWGGQDYQDVRKLSDWLFSRPWVDSKRVGVTGGSYGGFMTNWIVGREQRFRAAVTQRSCVNFESFFGTSDSGHVLAGELGGMPWKGAEKLRRQSPLTCVENIRTPLLIIHSEQDLRCPIEQAEQLFVALKYLRREVEYVAFEGESHGLSRGGRSKNRAERLRRIVGWFDRWMK